PVGIRLRTYASARVLIDEDEPFLLEMFRRPERRAVIVDAIRGDAVGRARKQERIRLRSVFGRVDDGEQSNAVAHRDQEFVLGVTLLDGVRVLRGGLRGREARR